MEIGRVTSISITCKDCNKVFPMNRKEVQWYSRMDYPLPKRCPECRMKRKEAKKREKKTDANTREPQ